MQVQSAKYSYLQIVVCLYLNERTRDNRVFCCCVGKYAQNVCVDYLVVVVSSDIKINEMLSSGLIKRIYRSDRRVICGTPIWNAHKSDSRAGN